MSAADVDGDGDTDVLAAAYDDDTITWYENDGTPRGVPWDRNLISADVAGAYAVSAADIDLPDSISVDFEASRLRSPNGQRTSPIGSIEVSEATLIAQGNQNGRGWSMAIDRETGRMTASIAETAGAMVLSGSCGKAP